MRWIRQNVRLGAACALFALAIQLALSFSHVHLGPIAGSQPASLVQLALDTPDSGGGLKHKPNRPADNTCDICILIQLAGSSTPAAAPQLAQPVAFGPAWHAIRTDRSLTASRLALFQARGPPIV
jgi:hypothetical protein